MARRVLSNEDALAYELRAESARSLGVAARRMEEALAALAACAEHTPGHESARDLAAQTTHAYVVQRELMGMRDTEWVLTFYKVPQAVRARLGAVKR